MNLEHVALTINDHQEIADFYQEILGLTHVGSHALKKDLAREIFGIEQDTTVDYLEKEGFVLELFLMPAGFKTCYNHLCFSVPDREVMVEKAMQAAYECIRIIRKNSDMIFLKDKSGNIFEIKQCK
jgi:catechol 2,3-dioxygenase-like lactoylglutathione lyase family enzyme